ncbi:hypothetical protein PMAYCL1PPCAC_25406, partial [Pristionchus mayeri]
RGRRKTQWRPVNLADYDPICAGEYDLEEYVPPPPTKAPKPEAYEDTVTTRSDWKYMGKQVRKMLIPGSISAFASCMWVSFELVHGTSIPAFSKIVELALPFWDAMLPEEQKAWVDRALSEGRRAHWIYVRNGRAGAGGNAMGASSHIQCHSASESRPPRGRKKAQEWDDDYDDDELSDTDELPSRPTRKLNIDGDDAEPVPKEFKSSEDAPQATPAQPQPYRPAPIGTKTVTFKMDHEPEPPREPWRERDGTRTVPPPPATYRPIIVSANPQPVQNKPPPPSYYPAQSAMRGRGSYASARRHSRGGFDVYPASASSAHVGAPHAPHHAPPALSAWPSPWPPR